METAGNQEEPAVIACFGIVKLDLVVIIRACLGGQGRVSPAVPNHQLALSVLKPVEVGVGGIQERTESHHRDF